jgi:hypothetical protein
MKGEITLKILETASETILSAGDLIAAILGAKYGASLSTIQYRANLRQSNRENKQTHKKKREQIKQKYYKLIYVLKKDGLIKEVEGEDKSVLIITKKGTDKIVALRNKKRRALPNIYYKKENAINLIIVMFDIPEKERRKRAWLRAVLKNLGLKLIQKSVWIGKTKIPQPFLKDLADLRLINFVEIFEITKTGSLKHII